MKSELGHQSGDETALNITRIEGPPTPDAIGEAVRTWVRANWDPQRSLVEWRQKLAMAGWGGPVLATSLVRPRTADVVRRRSCTAKC